MIAYEDNASRKVLSIGEFDNATTENAIMILKEAQEHVRIFNASIDTLNTGRGAQLYQNKKDKNGDAESVFQNYQT
ncbi:MAG: hypothetical protein M8349_00550 [ANME-2 cluster archaeon]|nr:hypothetical protein [ANME-2 cluster archaeon]